MKIIAINLWQQALLFGRQKITPQNKQELPSRELEWKIIKQLNHGKYEKRLDAIYTLERFSAQNPQQSWKVIEILSSFVRSHALIVDEEEIQKSKIDTDIQAALTVIIKRDIKQDPKNQQVNLSNTDLRGANLEAANLQNANLHGVILYQANLTKANLSGANLCGAILSAANLEQANLEQANLQGAILGAANLQEANLYGANLQGANLFLAKMNNTNFAQKCI